MEEMGIGCRQAGEVQIPNLVAPDTNYTIEFCEQGIRSTLENRTG